MRAAPAKLGNEAFLAKAPDAVVAKIRDRLRTAAEADHRARSTRRSTALPPRVSPARPWTESWRRADAEQRAA